MVTKHRNLTEKEKRLWSLLDQGSADAVKELLDDDTGPWEVNCCDEHGTTALMQASFKGNVDVCRLLLKYGADVNANDHEHAYTALMFAALSGNAELCRVLLQHGAKSYQVNRIGRTAAEMAAFTGQHHCVSVINNFVAQDDIESLLQPSPHEPPRLPLRFAPILHELSRTYNIHPVKTIQFLVCHSDLLEHRKQLLIVFEELYEGQMKRKDVNEVMAIKLHIIFTTLREAFTYVEKAQGDKEPIECLKAFIKWLLLTEKSPHFTENMEVMLRRCIQKFPYHQSVLFQTIVRQLADTELGKTPTAINVIQQVILGHRQAIDSHFCGACGEPRSQKRCAKCKMENYCSVDCQRVHWFTHKKWCAQLGKEYEEMKRAQQAQIQAEEKQREAEEQTEREAEANVDDTQSENNSPSVDVDDVSVQLDKLLTNTEDGESELRKRNVSKPEDDS